MLDKIKTLFIHDYTHLFAIMVVGAVLGLFASFTLSIEAVELAKNSNAVLPCDFAAALSCSTVGKHPTASILGFPNAFVGVISFSVMLTVAVAGLMKTRYPKLFMYLAWAGGVAGLVFATWMFLISVFVIGVLCPWCLTTDIATLVVLWALTRYNIRENNLYMQKGTQKKMERFVTKNYDVMVSVGIAVIAAVTVILTLGSQLF